MKEKEGKTDGGRSNLLSEGRRLLSSGSLGGGGRLDSGCLNSLDFLNGNGNGGVGSRHYCKKCECELRTRIRRRRGEGGIRRRTCRNYK